MKTIKLGVFGILVLMGFLFMGELSLLNLSTFQEAYYEADFYINSSGREVNSHEMIEDLCRAGKKHNVDFFALEYSWDKSYLYETRIIGTKGAIEHLKKSGIKEGANKSLFFENQRALFCDIQEETDISNITTWYFTGGKEEYENIRAFKVDLVDKYGGGFPKEMGSGAGTILSLLFVWCTVFCIVLALSLYETAYMKKEAMLRVIMGENIVRLYLKSVLQDTAAFVLLFIFLSFVLRLVSNVAFKLPWVSGLFVLFLLLNLAIQAGMLRLDYKKTLASGTGDNGFLAINYVIKAGLAIVAILVVSINVTMISEALDLYEQKDFFRKHSNCSYYKMSYGVDAITEEQDPDEGLYKRFYAAFQNQSFQYADLSEYYTLRHPFIVINRNSLQELTSQYPQLAAIKQAVGTSKISLLLPASIKEGSADYENVMEMNDDIRFSESEYGKWKIISYENGIQVVGIHSNSTGHTTSNYRDPILLLDNTSYKTEASTTGYDFYSNYDILYHIPAKQWEQFRSKAKLEDRYISITNAMEEYTHEWNQSKRKMILSIVLAAFVLFLELSLIALIIQMEYHFNAIEMAIRKVHGYSLYERNVRLVKATLIFGILGIVLSIILGRLLNVGVSAWQLAVVGTVLILAEMGCIFIKANSVEKRKVAAILKGENV